MGKAVRQNISRYVTGFAAMGLSLWFMLEGRESLAILFASAFFFLICFTDTLYSKIPNLCSLSLVLSGLGYNFSISGGAGLGWASLGFLAGIGLLFLPFMLGGMGAGDVKALAALGALVGPSAIFQVFLYTALIGGAMSLLHYVTNRNLIERLASWRMALFAYAGTKDTQCIKAASTGEMLKFPYAAAIALGYFSYLTWGKMI